MTVPSTVDREKSIALALEAWVIGSELGLLIISAQDAGLGDTHHQYMATESMLVHLRAVAEFLVGRHRKNTRGPARDDDLSAWRYVPEWTPRPVDHADALAELLPVLDKHLAHLTLDRARGVQHWPVVEPVDSVLAVAVDFDRVLYEAKGEIRPYLAPYIGRALSLWSEHRGALLELRTPATTFTTRAFMAPVGDDLGVGGWAARLGPFIHDALQPLWPDWPAWHDPSGIRPPAE